MNFHAATPRIPYGAAKAIVASLRVGDVCVLRPEYRYAFRNAADTQGIHVSLKSFWRGGRRLYQMKRVEVCAAETNAFRHVHPRLAIAA